MLQGLRLADDFEVIDYFTGIRRKRRDDLAGVDHAAAADGDDKVSSPGSQLPHTVFDERHRGLATDCEHGVVDAGSGQGGEQRRRAAGRSSRDHEGAAPHPSGERRHLAQRAGTEENPCGCGKLKTHIAPDSGADFLNAGMGQGIHRPGGRFLPELVGGILARGHSQ